MPLNIVTIMSYYKKAKGSLRMAPKNTLWQNDTVHASQYAQQLQSLNKVSQILASGVGDLKKVLTNVKTRGVWGEIQLANLLDQILTADQYEKNVKTKSTSNDFVEFAIKLPGKDEAMDNVVWLPIDAKFPQDVYHHLVDAQEKGDPVLVV